LFQAEDGIRDWSVTGVQTCALPIYWQVPLRVLGLLRGRGHSVESDIRKEDVGRPSSYARKPVGGEGTPIVSPVLRVYIFESHPDDEQHDTYLDHHDGGVETGALLDPDHQNGGDHQGDKERRQIKPEFNSENSWRVQQLPRPLREHRRLRAHYL